MPNSTTFFLQTLEHLGLGYAIAFSLAFPFLLATVFLFTYTCCIRRKPPNVTDPDVQLAHPRVIFVTEGFGDDDEADRFGQRSVMGLDAPTIESYPKILWSKQASRGGGGDSCCSICLCEYREREMVRMMPECCHRFHLTCLDAWLRINSSCPVCRTSSPMVTPMPTPLSELVPLSQFADNRRRHDETR